MYLLRSQLVQGVFPNNIDNYTRLFGSLELYQVMIFGIPDKTIMPLTSCSFRISCVI